MKAFVLLFCFHLVLPHTHAQDDSAAAILEDAVRGRCTAGRLVYLDSSLNFQSIFAAHYVRGRLHGLAGQDEASVPLTAGELRYIDTMFRRRGRVPWKDGLFPNSVRIPEDSLQLFVTPGRGAEYFNTQFARKYYYLSEVLFLPRSPIAVLQMIEMYSAYAGNVLLFVYVRRNGRWEKALRIPAGTFGGAAGSERTRPD